MGRVREKYCDRCQQLSTVLYRVRIDDSQTWQFICETCWPTVQQDNSHYQYGGTWKARKRH